jgi:hypothetical protein
MEGTMKTLAIACAVLVVSAVQASPDVVARIHGRDIPRAEVQSGSELLGKILGELLEDFAAREKVIPTKQDLAAPLFQGVPEPERAKVLRRWKTDQALYRKYGGRVAFQQFGPEPIDAYLKFLREEHAKHTFEILDPAYESAFWSVLTDAGKHTWIDGTEAKRLMMTAWWSAERPPDEVEKPRDDRVHVDTKESRLTSDSAGISIDAPAGNWLEITADLRSTRRWMVWVSEDRSRSYTVILERHPASKTTADYARQQFAHIASLARQSGSTVSEQRSTRSDFPAPGSTRYSYTLAKKGLPTQYGFGYLLAADGGIMIAVETLASSPEEPAGFREFVRSVRRKSG